MHDSVDLCGTEAAILVTAATSAFALDRGIFASYRYTLKNSVKRSQNWRRVGHRFNAYSIARKMRVFSLSCQNGDVPNSLGEQAANRPSAGIHNKPSASNRTTRISWCGWSITPGRIQ